MKIHQLPLGARFEYDGQEFVKSGPLFGTGKDGNQRLIPKYAHLNVVGEKELGQGRKGKALATDAVLKAFQSLHSECAELVPAEKRSELEAARERFLKALDLLP